MTIHQMRTTIAATPPSWWRTRRRISLVGCWHAAIPTVEHGTHPVNRSAAVCVWSGSTPRFVLPDDREKDDMELATLTPSTTTQITRLACKRVERLGCFNAQVTTIGMPFAGAYRVTLLGTVSGQRLELQALVVREWQDRYSCDNCWIVRHA